MKGITFLIINIFAAAVFAGEGHDMPVPKIAPEFENMKALIGTWEGHGNMGDKDAKITVTYELTSGGTAIIEKLSPGTKHEMVTMYSTRGNTVQATHYCMLGNQPEMKLKKADANRFEFEMDGTKGISNKNEMHMHGVTLTLNDNKLKQEWVNYKDNKKGQITAFELTKK